MDDIDEEIKNAYSLIHDKLSCMPAEFCYWKVDSGNGNISVKVKQDYWLNFYFMFDQDLRNNISQLRFVLDYYLSLYKLHGPGLLFGWHHKLVMCQILGSIYEGLLSDLLEQKNLIDNKNPLIQSFVKQNFAMKSFGLGRLLNLYQGAQLLVTKKEDWFQYVNHLKNLRDTVHPRSLNSEATWFSNNPLMQKDPKDLISDLEEFIQYFKNLY